MFRYTNLCAQFYQNRIQIATVGERTDGQKDASDFTICPAAMNSKRTDKEWCQ